MIGRHPVVLAAAEVIVPRFARFDDPQRAAFASIVDTAVAQRPAGVLRQFGLFLHVVDLMPVARYGRRFRSLDATRRARLLAALQDSRILPLRRGVWGLRTMVMMGCYAQPGVQAEVGYRAHPRGWLARTTEHA